MMEKSKVREPLFHIVKRDNLSFKKNILIRLLSIFFAILLCSLIVFLAYGYGPISFISSLIKGAFGTQRRFWIVLHELALVLGVSLALAPAFKMKFWNIGADGQTLMGCLGCIICMYYLGGTISNWLLIIIAFVVSIIFSMFWAFIPAFFKSRFKTNETLFTLMMNYIAIQLVAFAITSWVKGGSGVLNPIYDGNLPKVFNPYVLNIIIIAIMTIFVTIYLKYSKHGYELSLVGESENTAKYAGINVRKVIIRTMLLSGIICGIVGFLLVSGYNHTITTSIVDGRGFTAIIVTWLGKFNPLFMILTSFMVVFLSRGTSQLTTDLGITSNAFENIIIGIFYFFIIGFEFFIRYKIVFKKKRLKHVVKDDEKETFNLKGGKQ